MYIIRVTSSKNILPQNAFLFGLWPLKKYGEFQHNFDFFQKCSVLIEESQETNRFKKFVKIRSQ